MDASSDNAAARAAAAMGRLTIESFRLNAQLLATGDELARDRGMTSARWQVLGTLLRADGPLTVAQVARRMALARQSVQRVANDLADAGLVRFVAGSGHPRWPQVQPTARGRRVYAELEARRLAWAGRLVGPGELRALEAAADTLGRLSERIAARRSHDGAGTPET
jgi:DNA-binding MarR family transcriptional regulator